MLHCVLILVHVNDTRLDDNGWI